MRETDEQRKRAQHKGGINLMLKLTIRNRTKVHDLNDKPTSIAALVVLSFIPVLHSQANHCYQSHTPTAITKDVRKNVGE
jgi:hypothetical protein